MELLAAANILDLAERLCGDGWRDWILRNFPKGSRHRAFQAHRRVAVRLLAADTGRPDPSAFECGDELLRSWQRRGPALAGYGRLLAERPETADTAIMSILRLHYNRLAGIDPDGEGDAYATARGAVQAHVDRERHTGG